VELLRRLAASRLARALVSVGLLAAVLSQVDFAAIRSRLAHGSWGLFVLAVVAMFGSFLLGAVRWHVFLTAARVAATLRRAVDAYLVGAFTTNFLPTQFGGDVTRAVVAAGRGERMRSAGTVLLDRASALACMIAVGWVLVATDLGAVPSQLLAALGAATAVFTLASVMVVAVARGRGPSRLVPARLRPAAAELKTALELGLTRPVLVRTTLIGLVFQGLVYLSAWLVDRSISLGLPIAVLGAALAPVLIVAAAPVSIGGYGVREGAYVLMLGYAGVSTSDATLFSLLTGAVFALASLPGALVLLRAHL
jgi:glycosyltransferase 2 family protein